MYGTEMSFLRYLPLVKLWEIKSLLFYYSTVNVKLRYMGTNLGYLWNVLEPLLTFILLYIVFTSIRDRQEDFAIYLLSGIIFYHIFTRGTMAGSASLQSNKNIITSTNLRNEFFPVAAVGSIVLTSLVELAVYLGLFPVFQFMPSYTILLLPIPYLMMLGLVLGFSYLLSVMVVYIKDIQPVWAVVVHALFFVSPIFWYTDSVKGILLEILKINPVGQIIELNHNIVVFGKIPPLNEWLYTSSFVIGILFFGYFIFRKYEKKIAEEI